MNRRFWILLTMGMLVFFASVAAVLIALERDSVRMAFVGAGGMLIAAVLFLASAFLPSRKVDWRRIHAEQRLWESGPLGRSWLRIRQRLSKLWKL